MYSGIPSECKTIWIQTHPTILSGLIWVQTVCNQRNYFNRQRVNNLYFEFNPNIHKTYFAKEIATCIRRVRLAFSRVKHSRYSAGSFIRTKILSINVLNSSIYLTYTFAMILLVKLTTEIGELRKRIKLEDTPSILLLFKQVKQIP